MLLGPAVDCFFPPFVDLFIFQSQPPGLPVLI